MWSLILTGQCQALAPYEIHFPFLYKSLVFVIENPITVLQQRAVELVASRKHYGPWRRVSPQTTPSDLLAWHGMATHASSTGTQEPVFRVLLHHL